MPFWLQMLMAILPQLPSDVEQIASVFKPHAGTDTGTKIAQTLNALAPLAGAAVQFTAQHDQAQQPQQAVAQ